MTTDELNLRLAAARSAHAIGDLRRTLSRSFVAGAFDEVDYARLCARIDARDIVVRGSRAPATSTLALGALVSIFPPRRRAPTRDKRARWERKNRLGRSRVLPPALEARFTNGQLAVLRVIADEVRDHGCCARTVAELADRAGVSVTWAKRAIQLARGDGLIVTQVRPQRRARHKPTVIRIVSPEWLQWIARGARLKAAIRREDARASMSAAGGTLAPSSETHSDPSATCRSPDGGETRRRMADRRRSPPRSAKGG